MILSSAMSKVIIGGSKRIKSNGEKLVDFLYKKYFGN